MRKRPHLIPLLAVALVICLAQPLRAQNILPPNQPEQDACSALPLCGGSFSTPYSYQGEGKIFELSNTPCGGTEENSMWLRVTVAVSGKMAFSIIPKDPLDDYDFAVLDISFTGCNHIGPGNVVRCNFNNNLPGSNPGGIIGLSATGTLDNVQGGSFGNSFARALDVTAGETYLILVDNYGHDDIAGPSAGFTIDFSASTAGFQGNSPMSMTNVIKECSDSTITFDLSQPILCNSIATDGSDFSLNPSIPILGVNGVNCVAGGYTSRIVVRLGGHLPPGDYVLSARKGTDGNSLVDICGNELALPSTLTIAIPPSLKGHFISPADTTKCNYSSIILGTSWGFEKYLWYQGPATSTFKVSDPGLYRLSVTDSNGCMGTDSTLVKDSVCPQNVYLPSAFSPNGDGRNDLFRPTLIGATSYFRFIVFDRWGRAVFETSNPSAGWDGTINGRRQPAGVYVWMCQYTLYDRSPQVQRGTVTLIR